MEETYSNFLIYLELTVFEKILYICFNQSFLGQDKIAFFLHLKNFAKYIFFQMSICILVFRFFSLKPVFTLPCLL